MDHLQETRGSSTETEAISSEFDCEEQVTLEMTCGLEKLATAELEATKERERQNSTISMRLLIRGSIRNILADTKLINMPW